MGMNSRLSRAVGEGDKVMEAPLSYEERLRSGEYGMHFRRAGHWRDITIAADQLVAGERTTKLTLILSELSLALGPRQRLHVYAMGRSQCGKSFTQRRIGEFLLRKRFRAVNSASAKAIYYEASKNPHAIKGTVRLYDEFADQSEELQNQVKAFTSTGVDRATLDTVDIKREYLRVEVVGLPVVWTNSALPLENPGSEQLLNRFVKVNVDESPEQDKRIQDFQIDEELLGPSEMRAYDQILVAAERIDRIIGLGSYDVRNPFASFITMKHPEHRALRPKLNGLISGFALGNRFMRPVLDDSGTLIMASLSDNLAAIGLWAHFEAYQLRPVPERYVKLLSVMSPTTPMTKGEVASAWNEKHPDAKISPETAYRYLRECEKYNLVASSPREYSREYEYRRLSMAEGGSQVEYGPDGCLTSLIFGSLSFRIPSADELAQQIKRISASSLMKFQGTECELAEGLLDWEYAPHLFSALDLQPFSSTGSLEKESDGEKSDTSDLRRFMGGPA